MSLTHARTPDIPTPEPAQGSTMDCNPKLEPQTADPASHTAESELFWCPWLYSEVAIPEHVSASTPDTCLLPTYPHCPGPLLESMPAPVDRPAMSHGFAQDHPDLALIYKAVHSAGVPKYRGARKSVPHNNNIPAWRTRSHLFHDPSLMNMLEFAFPVGYTALHLPAPNSGNHPSANQFPADVSAYISKELQHSAIIGPADHHPFQWTRSNPMMMRPKKDSATRRVIVDLSMPQDASVNSGIPKNALDGAPFKLRLPNPATLASKILQYGQGCLLYKVDLSRAYRQLRTDPLDWPFVMLQWEDQHYVDIL